MTQTAYIALGSNVGDPVANLQRALVLIESHPDIRVIRTATPIITEPVDCPPGTPPFLNSAAALAVACTAHELLERLMRIEASLGRRRSVRNAPREIDLDILLFGDEVRRDPQLKIPHPRMHERAFVMIPLAEIAPEVVHPLLKKTARELCREITGN